MDSSTTKRPWLVVLFAVLVTGGGHVYLRRWLRALGWIALATVASAVFVSDPPTASQMLAGESPPVSELAPVLGVIVLSWIDAYRLVVANNAAASTDESAGRAADANSTESAEPDHCPACGREVDDDLDFCQWCSEPLEPAESDSTG